MSDPKRVIALLGQGVVPADAPILRGDDLGVLRGDGIFEALHVRDGQAWMLDEHLARMARSAARMELALPAAPVLRDLVEQVLPLWPAQTEGALRLVCTRGPEMGGDVTVFATISAVTASNVLARREESFLDASTVVYFTDVYDHLLRVSSRVDGLRELATAALETHLSVQSNLLNVTVERLAANWLVRSHIAALPRSSTSALRPRSRCSVAAWEGLSVPGMRAVT